MCACHPTHYDMIGVLLCILRPLTLILAWCELLKGGRSGHCPGASIWKPLQLFISSKQALPPCADRLMILHTVRDLSMSTFRSCKWPDLGFKRARTICRHHSRGRIGARPLCTCVVAAASGRRASSRRQRQAPLAWPVPGCLGRGPLR